MTIDEAKKYIEAQARKNQVGNIPIGQMNIYFKRAQLEIVNDLFGNIEQYQPERPVPLKSFEVTSIISDDLAPLIQSLDITQLVSGKATRPTDYLYFINLEADYYKASPGDVNDRIIAEHQLEPSWIIMHRHGKFTRINISRFEEINQNY